jgi:hypothetical protein
LIVDTEQEVRQNIVNWVEQIHQADLSSEAEQRLLMVMSQFIEEKFKILDYEEICKMLNLTPFEETTTFKKTYQRKLQEDFAEMLVQQIEAKFRFSQKTLAKLVLKLRQLALDDLKAMFKAIITMKRLKDLNAWIDQRLAAQAAVESPDELANL